MYYGFAPYVSVADKQKKAEKVIAKLRREGWDVKPIPGFKGKMAQTFWGQAWCENLAHWADYENRLQRGRSYVRAGCVCHMEVTPGEVHAQVNGSELYSVCVGVKPLDPARWHAVCEKIAGQIGSVLELLQGKISKKVMGIMSDPVGGIFPSIKEVAFDCSCPDGASMCKHVAAVLYGIGRRLDKEPEFLFTLRDVNAAELIGSGLHFSHEESEELTSDDLGALFGIDLVMDAPPSAPTAKATPKTKFPRKKTAPKTVKAADTSSRKDAAQAASVTQTPSVTKAPSAAPTPSVTKAPRPPFNPRRPTGAAIGKLRRMADLAPAAFARELGITFDTLNRWEENKGALKLRADSLEKLVFFQNALLDNLNK